MITSLQLRSGGEHSILSLLFGSGGEHSDQKLAVEVRRRRQRRRRAPVDMKSNKSIQI